MTAGWVVDWGRGGVETFDIARTFSPPLSVDITDQRIAPFLDRRTLGIVSKPYAFGEFNEAVHRWSAPCE